MIFRRPVLDDLDRRELDRVGFRVLPGLLTDEAAERVARSAARVEALAPDAPKARRPRRFAAEHDAFLEGLIAHPQMLALARAVLGEAIRFDHCVCLNRPPDDGGMRWHSHGYGESDPRLGLVRVFLYPTGFAADDGGLKVVPGSHRLREPDVRADSDAALRSGWLAGRRDPATGRPLAMASLSAPPGSVVLMWTHTVHGVTPRRAGGGTRWAVVYGYRNPGRPSPSRWVTPAFEARAGGGSEGLLASL